MAIKTSAVFQCISYDSLLFEQIFYLQESSSNATHKVACQFRSDVYQRSSFVWLQCVHSPSDWRDSFGEIQALTKLSRVRLPVACVECAIRRLQRSARPPQSSTLLITVDWEPHINNCRLIAKCRRPHRQASCARLDWQSASVCSAYGFR